MKRTPWFNARRDPPVNGDGNSEYELRCKDRRDGQIIRRPKWLITDHRVLCEYCQWRGLTKEPR